MSNLHLSDTSIISMLRKKGYKATPQRIAICRFVLASRDHPSAGIIYSQLKELHPTVSLATVYKTLQVLKSLRLVQELAFVDDETRFDSYVKPHVNMVCQRCGNINDLDDRAILEMITKIAGTVKFNIMGQRFDIYGICERCSKKTKSS